MAENDITITVDADNRTTAAFGAAARGARTVGEATENANRAFREADNRYQQAAIRLQQLAARQQDAARRAHDLRQEIDAARFAAASMGDTSETTANRIREMSRQQQEAARTAALLTHQHRSSTEQVNDLARAYRRAEQNAQQALRASLMFGAGARLGPNGTIGAGGNDPNAGPGFWARMLGRLPGNLGSIGMSGAGTAASGGSNPYVSAGVLAGGAAAVGLGAPLIGGAVTGAIGAAAGIGGVGLGVAGAIANDPEEFRKRWDAVIQDVTGRWVTASASWMEPVKESIDEVDHMLRRLPIESILSNSAAYLDPLTKGLTGFGINLSTGVDSLVRDVGPVIEMLGKRLPKLGDDFGRFFAAIGKGSVGGATALDDVLYAVGRLTKGLGVTLASLANMYEAIHHVGSALGDMAGASSDWVAGLLDGVPVLDRISERIKEFKKDGAEVDKGGRRFRGNDYEEQFKIVQKSADEATKAIKDYIDATQAMLDLAAGDKSAGLALSEGWIKLNKELRDGKRTLDVNTEAGVENQKALLDQVVAAENARQAQINLAGGVNASGDAIDSANSQFDANIQRIRAMAYALGYDKGQVDNLIASLGVLAVTSAAPKVELVGAKLAMSQGIALGALLNNLDHTYYPKVQVQVGGGVSLGNALHHAAGGPTSPGPSIINEWGGQSGIGGGEVVSLPTGSMVYGGAAASGGGGGASGGGGVQRIELYITGDDSRAATYALDTLANATRIRGNGSVQIAVMGKKAPV